VTLLTHKNRMKPKSPKRTSTTTPPAVRKFFPWLYYAMERDLGNRFFTTQIHKTRDGLAALEASQLFLANGFIYGGSILNIPQAIRTFLGARTQENRIDFSTNDVVYIPTRPPLDDDAPAKNRARRRIQRSGTALEVDVFKRLRSVFKTCTRSTIALNDELRLGPTHPQDAPDFKALKFHQNIGGKIERLEGDVPRAPRVNNLSVGYLVTLPALQSSPFRIVCCFGAGGTETLWFHLLLKKSHSDLFARALSCPDIRVWIFPFVWPDTAPHWLVCDPSELRVPEPECGDVIEWSL